MGLAASIGFNILSGKSDSVSSAVAKKLAKFRAKNYTSVVIDFQSKVKKEPN